MKICFFAPNIQYNAPHAGFSHTMNVCKQLHARGHEVTVVFQHDKKATFKRDGMRIITGTNWDKDGGKLTLDSILYFLSNVKELLVICSMHGIDVIHERSGLPRGVGIIVSRLLGIASVVEINALFIEEFDIKRIVLLLRFWRILMFRFTHRIVTQTRLLKRMISRDASPAKIIIVSNGVDPSVFHPGIASTGRRSFGIPEDAVVICFVGAFQPWHGVNRLIDFAKKMKAASMKAVFLMIGEGPLFQQFQETIKKDGLADYFWIAGSVPHEMVPSLVSNADIAIAPFDIDEYPVLKRHGFWWCPVKLFEYMAMKKPVVSIDAGDNPIIAPHGRASLLSPPGDFNLFYDNLVKLVQSKELREALGNHGLQHVRKYFTWKNLVGKIEAAYMEIRDRTRS